MEQSFIGGKFNIPPNFDFNILPNRDQKICVISIIGKSDLYISKNKGSHIETIVKRNAFSQFRVGQPNSNPVSVSSELSENSYIDGFYDPENHTIYLHLTGISDTGRLTEICEEIVEDDVKFEEICEILNQEDFYYAKLVLYLFIISHVVVVSNIGTNIDPSYVRFLKAIDSMRLSLQPHILSVLRVMAVSREWCSFGRPCSPRLLFICNLAPSPNTEALKKNPELLKRLQTTLEEQLYRLFRKTHLISNMSDKCLFAIPSTDPFVLVAMPNTPTRRDPADCYLQMILHGIDSFKPDLDEETALATAVKDFLQLHIDTALQHGFDDNIGRHSVPSVFELPACRAWFKVCHKLYTGIFTDQAEPGMRAALIRVSNQWDITGRFSESRCSKALPMAEARYREGLPGRYSRAVHLSKVGAARRLFLSQARGPRALHYLSQLEDSCLRVWLTGREMCEAVSVTGQPCRNEAHKLPPSHKGEEPVEGTESTEGNPAEENVASAASGDSELPLMPHRSNFQLRSACSCGKRQGDRPDPFDCWDANYNYYRQMGRICCDKYQSMPLPPDDVEGLHDPCLQEDETSLVESSNYSLSGEEVEESQELDENLPEVRGLISRMREFDLDREGSDDGACSESRKKRRPAPQPARTFFWGMLTDRTPEGKLPRFPSWCVLNLGKYFSYSHAIGIDQPGFLRGSNFLLPWDVQVKSKSWVVSNELLKKSKVKPRGKPDAGAGLVKVFMGFEYECPLGHRFFLAGPKRMMRGAMQGGQVKEAVNGLLTRDLPLYFPCQCSGPDQGYFAQLMRVWAAVPNSPVHVTLNPRVRPGPSATTPLFTPGNREPILLTPGNLWVARFPFAYQEGDTIHRMPQDLPSIDHCVLMKGCLSCVELD